MVSSRQAVDPGARLFGADPLDADEASGLLAQGPGPARRLDGRAGLRQDDADHPALRAPATRRAAHALRGLATLLAFERLAHPRRPLSGEPAPPAPRAAIDPEGREILHIALIAGELRVHLLLAELPSEIFRQLADNQLSTAGIPLLRRGDKLALLIDGGRLCDHDTRAAVLTRARQVIERLLADPAPHPGTELALVVTKWDLITADAEAMAYWQPREEQLLAEFRRLDPKALHLRVAAGAPPGYPADDGFAALRSWLLAPGPRQIDPPTAPYDWPLDAPPRLRRPRKRVPA